MGRGPETAEMLVTAVTGLVVVMLQWGRGPETAEM